MAHDVQINQDILPPSAFLSSVAAGRGEGVGEGASAPGWHCAGGTFGGAKYGILKFGRFWRIVVCIAGRIQRVR